MHCRKIAITPGEPAGIGPDIILKIAQQSFQAQLIVIADPNLLYERAKQLQLPISLHEYHGQNDILPAGHLYIFPEKLDHPVIPGQLDVRNAHYVMRTLTTAINGCLSKTFDALVTGPVHKGIINEAGIPFTGHTEFLAKLCEVDEVVMLLATDIMRVALVTTHLPLRKVPDAITFDKMTRIIPILSQGLTQHFQIPNPHIIVSGLNPHAGECGHLGDEEIRIITPALDHLRAQGFHITGPLPADTMFNSENLSIAHVFLCMYHDQGLNVLKYASFGHAANITLGLPFLRASVDHGTALTLAATGKAQSSSFSYALNQIL